LTGTGQWVSACQMIFDFIGNLNTPRMPTHAPFQCLYCDRPDPLKPDNVSGSLHAELGSKGAG
jgi:hypothetical protein